MSSQYWRGKAWTNVRPGGDIASVWNWDSGQYDYYRVPSSSRRPYGAEMKPPPAGQALGGVGEDPDVSSHPLPFGSKKVGSGSQALGNIVSLPQTPMAIASWAALGIAIAVPIAMLLGMVHLGDLFGGKDVVFAENEGSGDE